MSDKLNNPGPKERAETRTLAAEILTAVESDREMPKLLLFGDGECDDVYYDRSDVDDMLTTLAQEVALQAAEIELLRKDAQSARLDLMSAIGQDAETEAGLRAEIERLRALAEEFAARLSGHAHPAVYAADLERIRLLGTETKGG